MTLQHVLEKDGIAKAHVHLAESFTQRRQRTQHAEHRFLFFRLTGKLADVGFAFDQAFVPEVHRQKHDRAARIAQVAAQRHRQHAGFRRKQSAGATASTFDEVLDGMTARHDQPQILHEHHGVERIALEAAPHEERATSTQQPTDDRHVQIDPRGDMRNRVALEIDHVREQQIIHVTAMARHIDHLIAIGDLLQLFEIVQLHTVVETSPEPGQYARQERDKRVRIVGCDLADVAGRKLERFTPRDTLGAHLIEHGASDG